MNVFGKTEKSIIELAEIASTNLSELNLWYLGTVGVVFLLMMTLYIVGFLGVIYYTAKYHNINQANERMNSKISFKLLNGVADILAIYLIGLCVPLFLWWVAYLVKTYII